MILVAAARVDASANERRMIGHVSGGLTPGTSLY